MVGHWKQFVPGIPCLSSKHWSYKRPPCPSGIYMRSGDLNSGPHTGCLHSALTAEPSPWPMTFPSFCREEDAKDDDGSISEHNYP